MLRTKILRIMAVCIALALGVLLSMTTGFAAESDMVNGHTLSYPSVEDLDYYSQGGEAGHKIDYDAFALDGIPVDVGHIKKLAITTTAGASQTPGNLSAKNQWVYARNGVASSPITLSVTISGAAVGLEDKTANNLDFTIVIGQIKNTQLGAISYTPSIWTMDPYGFTDNAITLSIDDFTLEVNGAPKKLSELNNVSADDIRLTRSGATFKVEASETEAGEYTLTANNNNYTGDAMVRVAIDFPRANAAVSVTESAIKVAEIFMPTITASQTSYVKNLTLQQGVEANKSYKVPGFGPVDASASPTVTINENEWWHDFPTLRLFFDVNGIPGELNAEQMAYIRFGELRIYDEADAVEPVRQTARGADGKSLDLVDLVFKTLDTDYETPQIVANAETGTIRVTLNNVVLIWPGLNNLIVTPRGNEAGGITRFIYDITLVPTYTVILDYNDDTTPNATVNNVGGLSLTLPTPTRAGYTFVGWMLGEEIVSNPFTPGKNVTLVAQWRSATEQGTEEIVATPTPSSSSVPTVRPLDGGISPATGDNSSPWVPALVVILALGASFFTVRRLRKEIE